MISIVLINGDKITVPEDKETIIIIDDFVKVITKYGKKLRYLISKYSVLYISYPSF